VYSHFKLFWEIRLIQSALKCMTDRERVCLSVCLSILQKKILGLPNIVSESTYLYLILQSLYWGIIACTGLQLQMVDYGSVYRSTLLLST
jgi:hypothetical protein